MKKILLVLFGLWVLLCFSAMAEDEPYVVRLPDMGLAFTLPEDYASTTGMLSLEGGQEIIYGSGEYLCYILYVPMTSEAYEELTSRDDLSRDEIDDLQDTIEILFGCYGIDKDRTLEDANIYIQQMAQEYCFQELGKSGDITYYLFSPDPEASASAIPSPFAEEFRALYSKMDSIADSAVFSDLLDPYSALNGQALQFSTVDTEGNSVDSLDLFAQHEITMINVWASWCGPCIAELSELNSINERLADKDCAIVGLLYDGDDPDALQTGIGLMEEHGVHYTVILPPDNVDALLPIQAFPTSFFVNRNGEIVGSPIVGAYVDNYEPSIEALLNP